MAEVCSNYENPRVKQACDYTQDTLRNLNQIAQKNLSFLESQISKTQDKKIKDDIWLELDKTREAISQMKNMESMWFQQIQRWWYFDTLYSKLSIVENWQWLSSAIEQKIKKLTDAHIARTEIAKNNLPNKLPEGINSAIPRQPTQTAWLFWWYQTRQAQLDAQMQDAWLK